MILSSSAFCQVEYHLFKLSMCFCFCYQSFAGDSFSCGKHERGYRLEVTSTNPRRDYFHGRFRNILLTSIAVVPIQNHTVVSLGTAEGRVIQVRHVSFFPQCILCSSNFTVSILQTSICKWKQRTLSLCYVILHHPADIWQFQSFC